MAFVNAQERQLSALEPLELRHLPDEGLSYSEPVPQTWLKVALDGGATPGLDFEVLSAGRVTLTVQPLGPVDERPPIRIQGRLEATVQTDCVRCLESVSPAVEAEVDITLLASAEPVPADTEKKGRKVNGEDNRIEDWTAEDFPDPEALGESTYSGETLDIPYVLREALLLGLTTHPVCENEDDCDRRTAALIDDANKDARAADAAIDPRWAALQKLRDGEEQS